MLNYREPDCRELKCLLRKLKIKYDVLAAVERELKAPLTFREMARMIPDTDEPATLDDLEDLAKLVR